MTDDRPVLALTAGDAAGVGPEVIVKALAVAHVRRICRPLVVGWPDIIQVAADQIHLGLQVRQVREPEEACFEPDWIDVIEASRLHPDDYAMGQASSLTVKAAAEAVRRAARLAMGGKVDGIVTAPVSKEAVIGSGRLFPGDTELLAEVAGTSDWVMMLAAGNLRVVHLSAHIPLKEAIGLVQRDRILAAIRLTAEGCGYLGLMQPVIAVAGLNPHAGESGLFGQEEQQEILPAVQAANKEGIQAVGPLPPDRVFVRCSRGEFSAVIAMYHDQGHIPARMFDSKTSVNITLGLPFVRTSVDHDPAFNIAGKSIADPADAVEAIRAAAQLVWARRKQVR